MTNIAVLWFRRNARIGVVATKANRMTVGDGLEGTFFQPEIVTQVLRRFCHIFFAGIPLWLISGMAYGTTGRRFLLLCFLQRRSYKQSVFSLVCGLA